MLVGWEASFEIICGIVEILDESSNLPSFGLCLHCLVLINKMYAFEFFRGLKSFFQIKKTVIHN